MVRWEPGARERLQMAALELYLAQGFEQTTVAEIAGRAGLTERTFFRYFADKREVLFDGQDLFEQAFLTGVRTAPAATSPLGKIGRALEFSGQLFADERRYWSRRRQAVISATPALQERELLKLAALASAISVALRDTGVADPMATLAARTCVSVFEVAFAQWITDGENRSLIHLERGILDELAALATGPGVLPDR